MMIFKNNCVIKKRFLVLILKVTKIFFLHNANDLVRAFTTVVLNSYIAIFSHH